MNAFRWSLASTIAIAAVIGAPHALAQSATDTAVDGIDEEIVVTGTRTPNRSALETAVPVDVISSAQLEAKGTTELNQALSIAVPSFNFPRPAITDGTDAVRPATLRGLAPDQTLVLVNSKRRHTASLVNVNGSVGRGSAAVDLNTIPSAIIERVEVLRDGASAQYGSDAIAGVINIRLKERGEGGGASFTHGLRITTVDTIPAPPPPGATWTVQRSREVEDGATTTLSAWQGFSLGDRGFLTVAGEYREQDNTIRAAPDTRQQFPLVSGAFDPRENTIERLNSWYGDPRVDQLTFFANAGFDLAEGIELYGWASWQERDTISPGFFRRAVQERTTPPLSLGPQVTGSQNIIALYPEGFLPKIFTTSTDMSAAGGITFGLAGWEGDASISYGSNQLDFNVINSINVTLGPAVTQSSFFAGTLTYDQVTGNLSLVRGFDIGAASPLNVAVGIEARQETYEIGAGERNSWVDGGFRLNNTTLQWVNVGTGALPPGFSPAVPGAQVFPGFRPQNELNEDRTAIGAFLDLEVELTDQLLVSGAVRAENYSDFGETFTYKVAGRYDFTDFFAVRGAVQSGFRAPSLQQQFFSATATNFVAGVPREIVTVPASSALAATFGGRALEAEESQNYSLGVVLRAGDFSLTVDAYRINIDNRVTLSENIFPTGAQLALLPAGTSGIRFFVNGVDTETDGVEVVARHTLDETPIGEFDFTLSGNLMDQVVVRAPTTQIFGRVARFTLENGQPSQKFGFSTDWTLGAFSATARATHYGEVLEPGVNVAGTQDIRLEARTLVDFEGRVALNDSVRFAVGVENAFDQYPTATPNAGAQILNATGSLSFSRYSPFGFNGRYVYGRLAFEW
jgi:iron complex outermembrane receptor protein